MKLFWIGAGGALGSLARVLLETWIQDAHGGRFPFGTLAVNVLGSFAIGLVMQIAEARGALDSTLRIALTAGVLGGFTTYSGFNHQVLGCLRERAWLAGGAYLAGTAVSCLLAGVAGIVAGRWLSSSGG